MGWKLKSARYGIIADNLAVRMSIGIELGL
jgi:hypothetical protein